MQQVGIEETHLDLCGMDVDVVVFERHFNEQENYREPVRLEVSAVGFSDSVRDELVTDEPSVQEDVLGFAVRF